MASIIDWYSLDHLFLGFVIGMALVFRKFSFFKSGLIAGFLVVFWEVYERIMGVGESYLNSFFDILLGLAFFLLGYFLVKKYKFEFFRFRFTRHSNFFDMWSLIHLGFWGIIAGILLFFEINLIITLPFCLIIMIIYEYFERIIGVGEKFINSFGDIIFNLLGFLLIYLLNLKFSFSKDNLIGIVVNFGIIVMFLSFWGHDHYRNHKKSNKKI